MQEDTDTNGVSSHRPKDKKKSSRLSLPQNRVRTKQLAVVTDLDLYDFERVIGEGKFSDVRPGVRESFAGLVFFCLHD